MNLPIYIRKFWIKRHNQQANEERESSDNEAAAGKVGGVALNAYAKIEQGSEKHGGL